MVLENMRTLVLNSSYQFLNIKSSISVIGDIFENRLKVLQEYDYEIHSPSISIKIPSVVVYNTYIDAPFDRLMFVPYSDKAIFIRDNYTCQYCGTKTRKNSATTKKQSGLIREIEHIKPRSRGGITDWTNVVCACRSCNRVKGNRTPEEAGMKLKSKPKYPTNLLEILRIKIGNIHESWEPYLF